MDSLAKICTHVIFPASSEGLFEARVHVFLGGGALAKLGTFKAVQGANDS